MIKEINVCLNLAEKLSSDREFCKEFFRIQVQNDIAEQIISLRKSKKLRQIDLAEQSGMKQSAISRIEQADYASWNYQTLLRVVESLDARIKIVIEPIEEVIKDLKETEVQVSDPLSTYTSGNNLLMLQLGKASGTLAETPTLVAQDKNLGSRGDFALVA